MDDEASAAVASNDHAACHSSGSIVTVKFSNDNSAVYSTNSLDGAIFVWKI